MREYGTTVAEIRKGPRQLCFRRAPLARRQRLSLNVVLNAAPAACARRRDPERGTGSETIRRTAITLRGRQRTRRSLSNLRAPSPACLPSKVHRQLPAWNTDSVWRQRSRAIVSSRGLRASLIHVRQYRRTASPHRCRRASIYIANRGKSRQRQIHCVFLRPHRSIPGDLTTGRRVSSPPGVA